MAIQYIMEAKEAGVPDLQKKLEAVSEQYKNVALIPFADQPMVAACNGNCKTAERLNEDIISAGGDFKPEDDSEFPNKYCVRECLGCTELDPRKDYSEFIDRLIATKK